MRKCLCVGIDSYQNVPDLHGCVNDAVSVKEALARNGDGSLNFDVKILTATSENSYVTKKELNEAITELFASDSEIALLYFSGHGSIYDNGGYLCTSEVKCGKEGLSLIDVMKAVNTSRARNKIIILDSCHSGALGDVPFMPEFTVINSGTVILSACENSGYANEEDGHGVYTGLLIEALYGGAMNLLGEVSPGGVYSYIDRSLGAWEQRPVFKANIKESVSLRKNAPPISIDDLRKITELFPDPSYEYPLDHSYEPDKHEVEDKTKDEKHEEIFKLLQKYVKLSLVIPRGEEHMYYAAIHNKHCALTAQGQHYWKLVKKQTI